MCTADAHCFVREATASNDTVDHGIPVGHVCLCGRLRWGTEEELRAFDEVSALERAYQLPARESA